MRIYSKRDFFVGRYTVDLQLDPFIAIKARVRLWAKLTYKRLWDRLGCQHVTRTQGPRKPLRYGSAATEVCCHCGKYRFDIHGWSDWEPGPVRTERDEET